MKDSYFKMNLVMYVPQLNLYCFIVPDNSSIGDGTFFLHEYMIPRCSSSFCLYDTRSLSDNSPENIKILKHWMEHGVRHGELVVRSAFPSLYSRLILAL
mgnify:CR=1 FL=1